jgi:hypothetical protein
MKKLSMVVLVLSVLAVLGSTAQATLIDFETLVDNQNIHGVNLGGVTLYEPQLGIVEVYANSRDGVFYHSQANAVSSDRAASWAYPIIGVFDAPQVNVSLWAGDEGFDNDQWELEAFDAVAGGNSLGLVQSAIWNGNPYTQLSISAPGIWRFEARHLGPTTTGIGYDDLEFSDGFIPAPAAIVLGTLGTGLVGWLRRRRTL